MAGLCGGIGSIAWLFLGVSLIFAVIETLFALDAKYKALDRTPIPSAKKVGADPDAWAKLVEAVTKLLLALKDLPAWIAIFLAGLALLWSLGSIPKLCPPAPPPPGQAPGK